jgi:TPR repeat protein
MNWIKLYVCVCVAGMLAGCAKGPSEAYKEITTKADKKDWSGVYDDFTSKSQGKLDVTLEMVASMGAAFSEEKDSTKAESLAQLKGKELFAAVMGASGAEAGPVALGGEVIKEDVAGDKATLTVKNQKGKETIVTMLRENKQWKLVADMESTDDDAQADDDAALANEAEFRRTQQKAAEGDSTAQYTLGRMYDLGKGVSKDDSKAFEWYEKAALQGHVVSTYNLGALYYNGQGVTQDYSKAFVWFEKAALLGKADAQSILGNMYHLGQGVAQDDSKALEWYERAALQGDQDAQTMCNQLSEQIKKSRPTQEAALPSSTTADDGTTGKSGPTGEGAASGIEPSSEVAAPRAMASGTPPAPKYDSSSQQASVMSMAKMTANMPPEVEMKFRDSLNTILLIERSNYAKTISGKTADEIITIADDLKARQPEEPETSGMDWQKRMK